MPAAKPPAQTKRKRTRKRKRRVASSSSSSSSFDSSSSENEQEEKRVVAPPAPKPTELSSSDSESSNSSEDEPAKIQHTKMPPSQHMSPSPSPPPADLPSFLPSKGEDGIQMRDQEMKTKFRQFWMASVADGFRDDLEEIRKEPNLGTSRLALLIDSLASGADVFASSSSNSGANEMEIILG